MTRVLITGMSGVGKSSLLALLGEWGFPVIDTDYGPWKTSDGLWDMELMAEALDQHAEIIVSGTVENQGLFYDRFDHVILLSASEETLLRRVRQRTTNPYGSTRTQRSEIIENLRSVEPLLRQGATREIDATRNLTDIAREVALLLRPLEGFT